MKRVQQSLLTLMLALVCGLAPYPVRAAEQSGQGIMVSPVTIELNAAKGKSYTLDVKVTNVTAGELTLIGEVNDFRAKDETGTPDILQGEDNGAYSIRTWIEKPARFRLKSKESKTVKIPVRVPANAEPGGHYGVVRFSGIAPELEDTGVALSASVGTLILARVEGDIKETLQLRDFLFEQNGNQSWWFEATPVTAVERLSNSGSVHLKPAGTLELKDIFGRSVAKTTVNPDGRNVLPGSTRRYEQAITSGWMFGPYKASIELAYGTTGQVLLGETTVWFIPWRLILLILFILFILIFGGRMMLKRYNARVIAKHNKRSR